MNLEGVLTCGKKVREFPAWTHEVLAALQNAEEIGGPALDEYIQGMRLLANECQARARTANALIEDGTPTSDCPSCEKRRPRYLGDACFEAGSVCPHCGHVEPEPEPEDEEE